MVLDQSDLADNAYEVFRCKLQEADVSEMAPYFVSNHVFIVLCYLVTMYSDCNCSLSNVALFQATHICVICSGSISETVSFLQHYQVLWHNDQSM